ncbi:TPA: hypothetical protein IXF51_000109 [Enterococcus faecium Ef_aus0050]|uniref:YopX family protein n=1 Tax=Enterococcus faecium TaxID=1352 RepID=UPI000AC68B7E|nr:YopX family protein [Enterococcus faecium]HAQ1349502.1 hypothetical protein [Enterococcus faecium Ef_RPH1]HAQ1365396.1 hypothetical protein [Enterococcus faecium Ef_RPH2]HAQ1379424.1 hypothetical protein [Enterococcus faecium Ef_aus0091]HAQ1387719.1 hypothetical protein [Enterococcus faecium Ef_aus0057]HAQ1400142.1 hypothetical protein [Enterococcus faecium Ef_aus0071]HAQ1406003.1 hypothetical protein [Enterococcus faecium Ef_aus0069]HAQ1406499.1 hypothetical protein [Enterococcus faecium
MIPKFRAWYTPFKGKTIGQEMKYGQAGRLITHAEMAPDKYVLMQSTGLKDKNGVEIFDGDVVQAEQYLTTTIPVRINGIVKYSNRYTMFYLDNGSERHDLYMQSLGGSIYNFEIIGNIYENPELLEEQ